MDVKSTSGRQGYHLIFPFFSFLARTQIFIAPYQNFRSYFSAQYKGGVALNENNYYYYYYQLGRLLTARSVTTGHIVLIHTYLCLSDNKTRKEEKSFYIPLFLRFLMVVYFYSLYAIYYRPIRRSECVLLPKHRSVLDPIPSFFI